MAQAEGKISLLDQLRKAIEICMPDFRHYYRMTKKAKVVAVYASKEGKYYADVQPLRNDESDDPNEPVIAKVAIPILWAGAKRGVVCPPCLGTFCDLGYYDGDPNYPYISNFRWHAMDAPEAALNEFVIQLEPGVEIRIDKEKQIVMLTPSNWIVTIGGNANITAKGNVDVTAEGGHVAVSGAKEIILSAPTIYQNGNVVTGGQKIGSKGKVKECVDREQDGYLTITGNIKIGGSLTVAGSSSVAGNSSAGSRSGGVCPHKC